MEDIICTYRNALANIHILNVVYALILLYECNVPMIHYFCESWCPRTNTILIVAGETSISLWDIRTLAGLPITGIFYDEVVPTAADLTSSKDGKQYPPPSCRYLFAALWHITSNSKSSYVTFEEWFRFWFRGPKKYSTTRLPQPLSSWIFQRSIVWTPILRLFLLVDFDLGCIRPSVFKPASQLASGRRISLAIPMLTCIYKGLGELSSSFTPGNQVEPFPAHYVYA
ncbi:Protein MAIN-LIKE 2 [Bienertia sinuspersici]